MPALTRENIIGIYQSRLENEDCYSEISNATQHNLDYEVRRFGLHSFDKVAHGVLAFCIDGDSPVCVPWLVAPDAPEHDLIGGRHGLVKSEFYDVAKEANLKSLMSSMPTNVKRDDLLSTYVIHDSANNAPFTVICDSAGSTDATTAHVDLICELSCALPDHQILIGAGGETGPRMYVNIQGGSKSELAFGLARGFQVDTVAAPDDILGRTRELENYANYAQKHNLMPEEFWVLTKKAVQAYSDRRQVSLDKLCQEILAERDLEDS